jgi:hypothetical protein
LGETLLMQIAPALALISKTVKLIAKGKSVLKAVGTSAADSRCPATAPRG